MDSPPPASKIALEKKKLSQDTAKVVDKCLTHITIIPNLLALSTFLDEAKEYIHIITVGTRIS